MSPIYESPFDDGPLGYDEGLGGGHDRWLRNEQSKRPDAGPRLDPEEVAALDERSPLGFDEGLGSRAVEAARSYVEVRRELADKRIDANLHVLAGGDPANSPVSSDEISRLADQARHLAEDAADVQARFN